MLVNILAEVRQGDEESFRQAIDDGDYSWMMEMKPKWLEVSEANAFAGGKE